MQAHNKDKLLVLVLLLRSLGVRQVRFTANFFSFFVVFMATVITIKLITLPGEELQIAKNTPALITHHLNPTTGKSEIFLTFHSIPSDLKILHGSEDITARIRAAS